MLKIKMYTTHCPKCNILAKKLKALNMEYEEITDTEIMLAKGFTLMPMLEVDDMVMDFSTANDWINKQHKEN